MLVLGTQPARDDGFRFAACGRTEALDIGAVSPQPFGSFLRKVFSLAKWWQGKVLKRFLIM